MTESSQKFTKAQVQKHIHTAVSKAVKHLYIPEELYVPPTAALADPATTFQQLGIDSLSMTDILYNIEESLKARLSGSNYDFISEKNTIASFVDAAADILKKTGQLFEPQSMSSGQVQEKDRTYRRR